MNRIRAVIVALVAFATITSSCTPHDLAEWQQVTGIDLSSYQASNKTKFM